MNAEIKSNGGHDAHWHCSAGDDSFNDFFRDVTPPANTTRTKRLDRPEDIAHALHIAPTQTDRSIHRFMVVLVSLMVVCLVMSAIVWWKLLT